MAIINCAPNKLAVNLGVFMRVFFVLSVLFLCGCSASLDDYAESSPSLKLEQFFQGDLVAYGLVQDRRGNVLRRFKVDMNGQWDNNSGRLDEFFVYDDGEEQTRVWLLEKRANGAYSGTAADVDGVAIGRASGFALNWHYSLAVPIGANTWHFKLDDWMYLVDEKRMFNRTKMRKFGITVAELTLWIERLGD